VGSSMDAEATAGLLQQLRESVLNFRAGEEQTEQSGIPKHVNVYMFGPQGSGKTSFIRTCFRALMGSQIPKEISDLEQSLHRSDDGTSLYSVYKLTDGVCLHDTRGQREYTPEEQEQLRLVLEGRARPNSLIKQRKRYWLLLREFWRSDERMRKTFSRSVVLDQATIDTEPHFVFLVVDPNQQELLLEDEDFRGCYAELLREMGERGVPYAILCTHGDLLTPSMRAGLARLPALLLEAALQDADDPVAVRKALSTLVSGSVDGRYTSTVDALPESIRVVTNYTSPPGVVAARDTEQDMHCLLVLLNALRQAETFVKDRAAGTKTSPESTLEVSDVECSLL